MKHSHIHATTGYDTPERTKNIETLPKKEHLFSLPITVRMFRYTNMCVCVYMVFMTAQITQFLCFHNLGLDTQRALAKQFSLLKNNICESN